MIEVTAAIIRNPETGRILICQRPPRKQYGLLWEFPGGKTEPGESAEQCLRRECMEELNLELEEVIPFCKEEHDGIEVQFFLCPMSLNALTFMVDREHKALAWVSRSELKNYRFCPSDASMLKRADMDEIFGDKTVAK